jgi:phospholipid/cholesterol/gamma-HCH transport system substrate-binding protein
LAALIVVVIALLFVLFGGAGSHSYKLLFQNAGQLVPDNQVLIGGQPVGSVESIGLTDDNLAEVEVSVDQQLHEGSTAVIRATSLSGVANHYVSISPGPNSNPELEEGATLGLESTTTPVDLDQFLNTFPTPVRRALGQFFRGQAAIYAGIAPQANQAFKYLAPGLNRTGAFIGELAADQRQLERFVASSSKFTTAVAERGPVLSSAVSNASTALGAIASQSSAFNRALELLPPTFRQANTTFVNLRAALDDLDPLVETSKPATKNLAPFLQELRPVFSKLVPVFKNLRLAAGRPGFANDTNELLAALPAVEERAGKTFPHAEASIEAFQPNLELFRAYTPDLLNAFSGLGQITGYYDANGHYARVQLSDLNLFNFNGGSGELDPISPSQQFEAFASPTEVKRRCPGAATQPAADSSNPFTEPPFTGAPATPSECNATDVPPGP